MADQPLGKPTVGFVGVGNMGWPMAACLVRAGFPVHDQRFAPRGRQQLRPADRRHRARQPARSWRAASDVVITMLPTSAIVARGAGGGDDNVFAGMKPGTVVIEMSSGVPSVTQELAEKVAALGGH